MITRGVLPHERYRFKTRVFFPLSRSAGDGKAHV